MDRDTYETTERYVERSEVHAPIDIAWARPIDLQFISFVKSLIDAPLLEGETIRSRRNEELRKTKNKLNLMDDASYPAHRLERAKPGTQRRTSSAYRLYPTSFIGQLTGEEHTYALTTYLLATNSKSYERAHRAARLMPQRPIDELARIARYANARFVDAMGAKTHEHVTRATETVLLEGLANGSIEADRIPTIDRTVLAPR